MSQQANHKVSGQRNSDLSCTWVPGTLDTVLARYGTRTLQVSSARLARVFGPRALDDLYLKGSVTVHASAQQIALLA